MLARCLRPISPPWPKPSGRDHRTGRWVNSPGLVRRNLQAGAIFGRADYNYEPPRSLINSIANPAQ
jgi:hypothetical protein